MKKIILLLSFVLLSIISFVLTLNKLYTYSIISITVTVLVLIYLLIVLFQKKNPYDIYEKELNIITKTYEPLLVEVKKIPNFDVKNIIVLPIFEKIVDIQYDLKKPILYYKGLNTCSFMLLDTDIAYVYMLRVEAESISPVDEVISSIENANKKRRKEKKILEDIDKTTIIRLDDLKEYKVSPIRKVDLSKTCEITVTKEEIVENKDIKNKDKKVKKNRITERSRKWRNQQNKLKNKKE